MVEKLASLSSENSSKYISTMFREYKTVLVRWAPYANNIYIFFNIYIIREWFVQRGPPPLQMFDGKHRSRIIAREQFLKREGGGGVQISQQSENDASFEVF